MKNNKNFNREHKKKKKNQKQRMNKEKSQRHNERKYDYNNLIGRQEILPKANSQDFQIVVVNRSSSRRRRSRAHTQGITEIECKNEICSTVKECLV